LLRSKQRPDHIGARILLVTDLGYSRGNKCFLQVASGEGNILLADTNRFQDLQLMVQERLAFQLHHAFGAVVRQWAKTGALSRSQDDYFHVKSRDRKLW